MYIKKDETKLDKDYPFHIFRYYSSPGDDTEGQFHWHEFMEVTCVEDGSGCYYVNGQEYQVGAGDLIIFNNVDVHSWKAAKNMQLLVMTFSTDFISDGTHVFDYDYLVPFVERGSNFKNRIEKDEPYTDEIAYTMRQILLEYRERKLGYQLMIKADVLRILTILVRHFQKEEPADELLSVKKTQMKRLDKAFSYIKEHYMEKITLEEVAQVAYMSPNYFSTYFKKVTGKNLRDYLIELRVQKAEELLKNSDKSVLEIAGACGFTNTSNFYRLYKKETGRSPGETRSKMSKKV